MKIHDSRELHSSSQRSELSMVTKVSCAAVPEDLVLLSVLFYGDYLRCVCRTHRLYQERVPLKVAEFGNFCTFSYTALENELSEMPNGCEKKDVFWLCVTLMEVLTERLARDMNPIRLFHTRLMSFRSSCSFSEQTAVALIPSSTRLATRYTSTTPKPQTHQVIVNKL